MTAPDDVRACPFCGNAKMEVHHNAHAGITFLLCGDDRGRGGCGAVVSFRPNLTGSKAIQAYNRRAAHADMAERAEKAERERDFLVEEYERAVRCGKQGYLHAAMHLFNAITNARIFAHADLSGEVRELVEADRAVDEANAALRRLAMAGPRPGSYGTGWELRDAAHKQRLMDTLDAALDRRSAALAKFTQEKP